MAYYLTVCKLFGGRKEAKMSKYVKTGQKAPVSGQYRPVGSKTEVTFVKDHKIPPTSSGQTKFVLVDKTKHK